MDDILIEEVWKMYDAFYNRLKDRPILHPSEEAIKLVEMAVKCQTNKTLGRLAESIQMIAVKYPL